MEDFDKTVVGALETIWSFAFVTSFTAGLEILGHTTRHKYSTCLKQYGGYNHSFKILIRNTFRNTVKAVKTQRKREKQEKGKTVFC